MVYLPDLLAVKYIYIYTFLSINKSKPVQFLMTRPESLRFYEDEEEVLR